jgi:pimaricinolide synthase PimS1
LRVSVVGDGDGALHLTGTDADGLPVVSVDSLVARPVDERTLARAGDGNDSLFELEWVMAELASSSVAATRWALLGQFDEIEVDGEPYRDLAALSAAIAAGAPLPDVVLARAEDGAADDRLVYEAHHAIHSMLGLLQAWLADPRYTDVRLVVVTRGALAVHEGETPNLVSASLPGLLRSAQSEHPGRFFLVDLDGSSRAPWDELLGIEEPQLAFRDSKAYAPRLSRTCARTDDGIGLDREKTVLVTGGTGGLGAVLARHLAVEHGARHLLLVSRRGPAAAGAQELVADLAKLDCRAHVVACDVSDREQLAALLEGVSEQPEVGAVIHAAGVLEDGTIETLTGEQLERVVRPKLDAAWYLHELTKERELSQFILFSSAAPLLGGAGQGNYAAANAFLDALAIARRALGLPATSLAWGVWDNASGMMNVGGPQTAERAGRQLKARMGLLPLAVDEGLALFDLALAANAPLLVPARLDVSALRAQARSGLLPALLRGLVRVPARRAAGASLARRLAEVPETERDGVVLELVRSHVAAVLGHASSEAIDPDRPFNELGLDSLAAVELRNGIANATDLKLAPTLVFDHPTAREISMHVRDQVAVSGVGVEGSSASDTLTRLARNAYREGALNDMVPLLVQASRFLPSFTVGEEPPAHLVSLSSGPAVPKLLCIPSFLVGSGPHQFVRFARGFRGARGVSALSLPGFAGAEPAPASWAAAISAIAKAAEEFANGEPIALVGYSIGGLLAHGAAGQLAAAGTPPAGVVMIDTYVPEAEDEWSDVLSQVLAPILDGNDELVTISDIGLLTMASYSRAIVDWEPGRQEIPRLLIRASRSLVDAIGQPQVAPWQKSAWLETVDGDHFTVISDAAGQTAKVTETWLNSIDREPSRSGTP